MTLVVRGLGSGALLVTRGLGPALTSIYIYPLTIGSEEAFGVFVVTKPGEVVKRERVKGFEHDAWIQY